jgi:hypothetical protein
MELEGPLLRVPFEALKAAARTRARLAAELAEVAALQGTRADDLADVQQRLLTLKRKARRSCAPRGRAAAVA